MDLDKAIRELYAEKQRLEDAIATLEALLKSKSRRAALKLDPLKPAKRRGRKSMPPDERRAVSERMKRYWAQRRTAAQKNQPPA